LNQDNLWAGLSSFAVEMSELRDILVRADPFSLVLGDELCSGTESVSATALVASGIQHLLIKKSRFVFATHLHGLMDLPQVTSQSTLGIWHLKVLYDAAKDLLIYDRTLHRGPGSSLYGLEVARALHLPADFLESAQKIRRSLLGHAAEEEASGSQWNSQVIRKACELCRHPIVRDLEVHHIRHRAEANGEHFTDGSASDALSYLIVVCSKCHDKHHAGLLDIQPLIQTSSGPQRISPTGSPVATEPSVASTKLSKWTDEEKNTIVNLLQRLPNAPLKRIVFDLETQHGITISEGSLAKFRKHGLDTLS
jgi:DNA mismatch repair protein MutS